MYQIHKNDRQSHTNDPLSLISRQSVKTTKKHLVGSDYQAKPLKKGHNVS